MDGPADALASFPHSISLLNNCSYLSLTHLLEVIRPTTCFAMRHLTSNYIYLCIFFVLYVGSISSSYVKSNRTIINDYPKYTNSVNELSLRNVIQKEDTILLLPPQSARQNPSRSLRGMSSSNHSPPPSTIKGQRHLASGNTPADAIYVDYPMFVSSGSRFPQSVSLQSDPQFGIAMGWYGEGFISMASPRQVINDLNRVTLSKPLTSTSPFRVLLKYNQGVILATNSTVIRAWSPTPKSWSITATLSLSTIQNVSPALFASATYNRAFAIGTNIMAVSGTLVDSLTGKTTDSYVSLYFLQTGVWSYHKSSQQLLLKRNLDGVSPDQGYQSFGSSLYIVTVSSSSTDPVELIFVGCPICFGSGATFIYAYRPSSSLAVTLMTTLSYAEPVIANSQPLFGFSISGALHQSLSSSLVSPSVIIVAISAPGASTIFTYRYTFYSNKYSNGTVTNSASWKIVCTTIGPAGSNLGASLDLARGSGTGWGYGQGPIDAQTESTEDVTITIVVGSSVLHRLGIIAFRKNVCSSLVYLAMQTTKAGEWDAGNIVAVGYDPTVNTFHMFLGAPGFVTADANGNIVTLGTVGYTAYCKRHYYRIGSSNSVSCIACSVGYWSNGGLSSSCIGCPTAGKPLKSQWKSGPHGNCEWECLPNYNAPSCLSCDSINSQIQTSNGSWTAVNNTCVFNCNLGFSPSKTNSYLCQPCPAGILPIFGSWVQDSCDWTCQNGYVSRLVSGAIQQDCVACTNQKPLLARWASNCNYVCTNVPHAIVNATTCQIACNLGYSLTSNNECCTQKDSASQVILRGCTRVCQSGYIFSSGLGICIVDCSAYSSCNSCNSASMCGWCAWSQRCMYGDPLGVMDGNCMTGWRLCDGSFVFQVVIPVCVGLSCSLAVLVVMYAWLRRRCFGVGDELAAEDTISVVRSPSRRSRQRGLVIKMPGLVSIAPDVTPEGGDGDMLEPCSICIDDIKPGNALRTMPCSHMFHKECIEVWLNNNDVCPLCKRDLFDGSDQNNGRRSEPLVLPPLGWLPEVFAVGGPSGPRGNESIQVQVYSYSPPSTTVLNMSLREAIHLVQTVQAPDGTGTGELTLSFFDRNMFHNYNLLTVNIIIELLDPIQFQFLRQPDMASASRLDPAPSYSVAAMVELDAAVSTDAVACTGVGIWNEGQHSVSVNRNDVDDVNDDDISNLVIAPNDDGRSLEICTNELSEMVVDSTHMADYGCMEMTTMSGNEASSAVEESLP